MVTHQISDELMDNILQIYKDLETLRGEPNTELDQYFITPESSLQKALLVNPQGYNGKRIALLGDMDLLSVSIGKISKPKDLAILDIDKRVPELIFKLKFNHKIRSARFVNHDLRIRMLAVLKNQYDYIFVEPPFTIEGLEVGLSRAVQCARKDTDSKIILTWDAKENRDEIVNSFIDKMNLKIEEVCQNYTHYSYETPLNKKSATTYILKVKPESKETISNHYFGPYYFRESSIEPKPYRCKCGAIYTVGQGGDFETLSSLMEKGCPKCGHKEVFVFNSSIKME
ncbi:MAG: bis-aminopropyl spermidine synthase family protein [Candidatus Heimdallarchaeaceae archaeon]